MSSAVKVVCLLPARNAATDLPGYLASAAQVCDAIVALDDGSTDETADLLAADPLVVRLLRNPRRDDYADWDDAANRNRLLAAAAELNPDWILSMDADERIDPSDAAALRPFLATDALPGFAYGLQHVAMRGDPDHYLPQTQTVYRLFSFAPGQRFPDRKLHFVPVPTAIPRARWLPTTIRLQHLGSMTAERRLARFVKYVEADPERRFHADYRHLLAETDQAALRRWTARPPDIPVLLDAVTPTVGDEISIPSSADSSRPALSAIIIARDNATTIAQTVRSVVNQEMPEPFETIVVVSGSPRTASIVREHFPKVHLIDAPMPLLPGEARNAGLQVAQGEFVSFPGSHVELPPGSLAARLRAHRAGFVMVTGVAENGTMSRAGWASYFMDQHGGLPGHRRAVLDRAPHRCSYARDPLLAIGGFPSGTRTAEDTAVNERLFRQGYVALREPAIRFTHRSPCRTPWRLVRHHFRRGRGLGWLLLQNPEKSGGNGLRSIYRSHGLGYLKGWRSAIERGVQSADPAFLPRFERVRPLILVGTLAAMTGLWFELLRPQRGKWSQITGRARSTIVVIEESRHRPEMYVARIDVVTHEFRGVAFPPEVLLTDPDGRRRHLANAIAAEIGPDRLALDRIRDMVTRAIDLPVDEVVVVRSRHDARSSRDGGVSRPIRRGDIRWSTVHRRDRRRLVDWLNRAMTNGPTVETGRGATAPPTPADPLMEIQAIHAALGVHPPVGMEWATAPTTFWP